MEKRTGSRDGGQKQLDVARKVRSPCPPAVPSSGEGSLGEIQTLQECCHCIALVALI